MEENLTKRTSSLSLDASSTPTKGAVVDRTWTVDQSLPDLLRP